MASYCPRMSSILVIDDDAGVREMLEQTLTAAGYQVTTASNGKQASSLYHSHPPTLVITDIYMPDRDGLEVIMELHQDFPSTKIIAISGQVNRNMLPVSLALGALRTLCKPFEPEELLRAVAEVLPPA